MKTVKAFYFQKNCINFPAEIKRTKMEYNEIPDELDTFYRLIGCDNIDIVVRKIGNKYYDIICDDEALLKDDIIISMYCPEDGNYNIYGSVIIAGLADKNGELTDLSEEDVKNIKESIRIIGYTKEINGKLEDCVSAVILLQQN